MALKQAPSGSDEPYSDASSSYWPEGWNWARYSDPDNSELPPEEELAKMLDGLKERLGEDGMDKMRAYLTRKHQRLEDRRLREQGVPPPEYSAPNFLKERQERYPSGGPWGFVAFRTVLYDNEEKWVEFKERVRVIFNIPFDLVVEQHRGHEYDEVADGRKTFTLQWVEDKELEGATEELLRERYIAMKKEVPPGMNYPMFLCTCPEAVESVLSNDLPTVESLRWRDDAPFLLSVMEIPEMNPHDHEECDPEDIFDEANWYQTVFKVPVEIIPEEFWFLNESQIFPLTRLTRHVKGCNQLLGGKVPKNLPGVGDSAELWWGMGPSPQRMKRRMQMRGWS